MPSAVSPIATRFSAALTLALLLTAVFAIAAERGEAMAVLSSKFGDKDPCAGLGVDDKGNTLIKRNTGGPKAEKRVDVLIQCSPRIEMPFGTLLADDLVAEHYFNSHRGEPFFEGNVENEAPYQWLNTFGTPYIKGEIAEALRLQQIQGSKVVVDALIGAAGGAGGTLGISLIVCAVGGVPSLGLTCAGAAAVAGAVIVGALSSAVGSVIKDFINAQYNRIKAMGDAQWFIWSNSFVTWNSFGDITDTWINPSFTSADPFKGTYVRIGVQFSNVPLGQGADYFSAKDGGSNLAGSPGKPLTEEQARRIGGQISSLNFNTGEAGITPHGPDRVRTGGAGPDALRGGAGDDVLQTLGGRNRASGGAGDDYLAGGGGEDSLATGPGRDVAVGRAGDDLLRGLAGSDILIGGRGADLLEGGPDADWLLDARGPTRVLTGIRTRRGVDFVNVRDGRADDLVICQTRATRVIADPGDRIRGTCGRVVQRGPLLRMPG